MKERGREGAGVVAVEENGEGSLEGVRVSIESKEFEELYRGGRGEFEGEGEFSPIVDARVEFEEELEEFIVELGVYLWLLQGLLDSILVRG